MSSRNVDCDNYPNECSQPGKVLDTLVGQVQSFHPDTKERRRASLLPHSLSRRPCLLIHSLPRIVLTPEVKTGSLEREGTEGTFDVFSLF